MTKLLTINLRRGIPAPEAVPHQADLTRLFDDLNVGLNEGQLCEPNWGRMRVTLRDDRESPAGLTDFIMTVPFWIVSRRFALLLEAHQCQCEFLPLEITYRKKILMGEFFALNVLTVEDAAIDLAHSEFDPRLLKHGLMREVTKLVLKPDALTSTSLAYLPQIGQIAVQDELSQEFERELVGVKFVDPAAFTS
ncbi:MULTISPECIES: DUF1629 domain-containing protein [unclassified Variovorax]|uniref:imm11 family protein n=1 Tax=unclassified Variovorax TaxID=663243 RepID=UPI0032E6309B